MVLLSSFINDSIPIFTINHSIFPLVKDDIKKLKLACLDAKNELGMKVSLIVIATLARCLGAADENLAKDMGAVIAGCDKLKGNTDTSILIVRHTSKDESIGARELNALTTLLVCEFLISRYGKNSNNQYECTIMKVVESYLRKNDKFKNIKLYLVR